VQKPALTFDLRAWSTIVALCTVASVALFLLGLTAPVLFGSLVGGMVYALAADRPFEVPAWAFGLGQGLIGATIGALVSISTLATLGDDWFPIVAITAATLVVSVLVGQALRLRPGVSTATAGFAMVAGGASGIVAVSRELGADDRVVTVVQYLRVLLVLLAMPAVTVLVFRPEMGQGDPAAAPASVGWLAGAGFTAVSLAVGVALGRLARLPAGALLGPLLVAVGLAVSGLFDEAGVPVLLQNVGYALIGSQVGLRFTRSSLRAIGRLLPLATVLILVVIAISAGLGVLLSLTTGVSLLTGYLATTPGGLYAVLATAVDSGSEVTFVLAVQLIRIFMALLTAPLLARVLPRPAPATGPTGQATGPGSAPE